CYTVCPQPHPHSLPTRRSSDLVRRPPVAGPAARHRPPATRRRPSGRPACVPTAPCSRTAKNPASSCPPPEPHPPAAARPPRAPRSEEHTSELQSRENLVCRLLL